MPAPSTVNFITPFDPTNYTGITGAQLEQLVAGLLPYTDKGFVIVTTDIGGNAEVPDADTNTQWQRYIWIRIGASLVTAYVWNPSGVSTTLRQWQSIISAGLTDGSVNTAAIADAAITDVKVNDVAWDKITGVPEGTNNVTGKYPSLTIANGVVATANLATSAVTATKIADTTITPAKMSPGSAGQVLRTNSGATGAEWATPAVANSLAGSTVVTTTNTLLKIPQVATELAGDGGTWAMKSVKELLAQVSYISPTPTIVSSISSVSPYVSELHGLVTMPAIARAVLVCWVDTAGYTASSSDEVPTECFSSYGSSAVDASIGALSVDKDNITFTFLPAALTTMYIKNKSTGAKASTPASSWKLKLYARL